MREKLGHGIDHLVRIDLGKSSASCKARRTKGKVRALSRAGGLVGEREIEIKDHGVDQRGLSVDQENACRKALRRGRRSP